MVTVHKCKECQQTFLSWNEFDAHVNRHLQRHLDEYAPKIPEKKKTPWEAFSSIPEGMNRALLKVFEKYDLGDKSILCLWRNGHLSSALRERSLELELQARLSEWLKEK
jgi:hypothetical protein